MSKYLFILSPPYAGSTVLWQLLQTSPQISALPTEGQYLEPVKTIMTGKSDKAGQPLPWDWIRQEWSKHWDLSKPVLIDKSTRSLSHAKDIEQAFENAYFIALMRDPYALCEGLARRRNRRNRLMAASPSTAPMPNAGEPDAMALAADRWRQYANRQVRNCRELERVLCLTYEELTERTAEALEKISSFLPELEGLDATRKFLVHSVIGTDRRALTNMNEIKWQCLSRKNIASINGVLSQSADSLAFFGYSVRQPDRFQDLRAAMIRSTALAQKLKNEAREALKGRRLATTGRSRWSRLFRSAAGPFQLPASPGSRSAANQGGEPPRYMSKPGPGPGPVRQ